MECESKGCPKTGIHMVFISGDDIQLCTPHSIVYNRMMKENLYAKEARI